MYSQEQSDHLVNLYLDGADRDWLDPILDVCTAIYKQLETEDQIKFKSAAKAFVRTYGFSVRFCLMEMPNGRNCPFS